MLNKHSPTPRFSIFQCRHVQHKHFYLDDCLLRWLRDVATFYFMAQPSPSALASFLSGISETKEVGVGKGP